MNPNEQPSNSDSHRNNIIADDDKKGLTDIATIIDTEKEDVKKPPESYIKLVKFIITISLWVHNLNGNHHVHIHWVTKAVLSQSLYSQYR